MLRRTGIAIAALVAAWANAALAQSSNDAEVLSSFQALAGKYEGVFSRTQFVVVRVQHQYVPQGAYVASAYEAKKVEYNVERTTSLVSPFVGTIDVTFQHSLDDRVCGNVRHAKPLKSIAGWATADEAVEEISKPECRTARSTFLDPVRFNFALQGGKWVLKSVVRTRYARPETMIQAAIQKESPDPQYTWVDVAPNRVWQTLLP